MALYPYGNSSKKPTPAGTTEFELLKASHRFLREDDDSESNMTWEEKLASKYYSNLYREFAVCDLKHYKSGNFALRWRAEAEVLSGAGETTCGNTRCEHHDPPRSTRYDDSDSRKKKPSLATLELPFVYAEHGETKSALVKVVLCDKCLNKLMWKRRKEKKERERGQAAETRRDGDEGGAEQPHVKEEDIEPVLVHKSVGNSSRRSYPKDGEHERDTRHRGERKDRWERSREEHSRRDRSSRSHSPRSRTKEPSRRRE